MAKISWAGQSCFQISVFPTKSRILGGIGTNSRDNSADIVIDPFDDSLGLKVPNFSADIALVTHDHHDHNNVKALKGDPFVISGPGEYEVKGVFVQGIHSYHDEEEGKKRGQNTIYVFEAEDMRFCHLGDLGQKQLTDEQLEKIDSVDILMIPVGGEYTIDSSEASKIIAQIEPLIVIPMHYSVSRLQSNRGSSAESGPKLKLKLDGVDKFLKTMGKNSITPVDKFTIKASVLPKDGAMEIVVLQP
ncbi:MAG: MBL fold metallo-hydrolase [bacterium]